MPNFLSKRFILMIFAALFCCFALIGRTDAQALRISDRSVAGNLDTIIPGMTEASIKKAGFKKIREAKGEILAAYSAPFTWDGYEFNANALIKDGKAHIFTIEGEAKVPVLGMFFSSMKNKSFLPFAVTFDGKDEKYFPLRIAESWSKEDCVNSAEEAVKKWISEGKQSVYVIYIPETVFDSVVTPDGINFGKHSEERGFLFGLERNENKMIIQSTPIYNLMD